MTDLDRARALIHAWACDEHRELRLIGKSQEHLPSLMERVADELAAARREGAAEMRERAAQKAESDDWSDVYGWNPIALHIAAAIRVLRLTPKEPT